MSQKNVNDNVESLNICVPNSRVGYKVVKKNRCHCDLVCRQKKSQTERAIGPQVTNIGDLNITNAQGKIHLGAQLTFNGPVHLTGLSKRNLIIMNNSTGKSRKIGEGMKIGVSKTNMNGKAFVKRCSAKKWFFVVLSIILIDITVLGVFLENSYRQDKKLNRYCGLSCLINYIHSGLKKNLIPRKRWGFEHNCRFDCLNKLVKSRIRLLLVNSKIWFCLFENSLAFNVEYRNCEEYLGNEFEKQMNNSLLNDIYYNYIIGINDNIYEGRSLNCPFEEEMELLSKDHSNVITIGIPYCFPGDTEANDYFTEKIIKSINSLTSTLQNVGVLTTNLTWEFPDICNHTLIYIFTTKTIPKDDRVTFYNYYETDLTGVSSLINPEIISDILWQSIPKNNLSDTNNITTIDEYLNFRLQPLYTSYKCEDQVYNFYTAQTFHIIFKFLSWYWPPLDVNKITDLPYFRENAMKLNEKNNSINYFLFPDGIIFKGIPVECLNTFSYDYNTSIISSQINIHVELLESPQNDLNYLFKSFKLIADDVREYHPFINYSTKHFSSLNKPGVIKNTYLFPCFDESTRFSIHTVYGMLTDDTRYYGLFPWSEDVYQSWKDCYIKKKKHKSWYDGLLNESNLISVSTEVYYLHL